MIALAVRRVIPAHRILFDGDPADLVVEFPHGFVAFVDVGLTVRLEKLLVCAGNKVLCKNVFCLELPYQCL